jgi:hypothetical protein
MFRRRGNSSDDKSGVTDLADVKAQEAERRRREDRERKAAERQRIWGDRSKYSVRDHLSYWAELAVEREREKRIEREYRRTTFKEMMREQREQLDRELRSEPKQEQRQERGQIIEHNVLDELRQQRERDRGRSLSDE